MVNHCVNKLVVEGPAKTIASFLKACEVGDDIFMLEGIVKLEDVLDPEKRRRGAYYDEQSFAWGSYSDVYDSDRFEFKIEKTNDYKTIVNFLTAYAPPNKWLKRVSEDKRFADLKFTLAFCENGMMFYGEHIIASGHEIFDKRNIPENFDDDDELVVAKGTHFEYFVKKWGLTYFGG